MADTLSRLPSESKEGHDILDQFDDYTYLNYVMQNSNTCLDYKVVARETVRDRLLKLVKRMIIHGWTDRSQKNFPEEIKPYSIRRNELSLEKGCTVWGQRVVIPSKLQARI